MASDRPTTPRDGWEKAANVLRHFGVGLVMIPFVALRDAVGWIGALAIAILFCLAVSALIARLGHRSRSRRLAADADRGVAEAFFRFLDEDNGRMPNHGWREGLLLLHEGGMSFRQLRGPGGPRVGEDISLDDPRVLGQRELTLQQAPGLTPEMKALGLTAEGREFEVALLSGYLEHRTFRELFEVRGSA